MNTYKILPVLLWLLAVSTIIRAQESWRISDDYTIKFSGTGAEGTFRGLEGQIIFDPHNFGNSKFDVSIDPSTIDTGNNTKDKHARGKSWFHVDKYSKIKFVSNKIYSSGRQYVTEGLLTLHGVEKNVEITFNFEESNGKATFEGKMTIDRQEFGIEGPFISFMVGDEFEVSLIVNAVKEN